MEIILEHEQNCGTSECGPVLTELVRGIHSSWASSKHFTWLALLAALYCSSFTKRIGFVRDMCQRQIGDCTVWPSSKIVEWLKNENSLPKAQVSSFTGRGGDVLQSHSLLRCLSPCSCTAQCLVEHRLQEEELLGKITARKYRSSSLVLWVPACHAKGCVMDLCDQTQPL